MINIINKLKKNLDDLKISYNLFENYSDNKNPNYFIVFHIQNFSLIDVNLFVNKISNIIIETHNGEFIFHHKYQIFVDTDNKLDAIDSFNNLLSFEEHLISINRFNLIKTLYTYCYHMTIKTGKVQHYLPAYFQKKFFKDEQIFYRYNIVNNKIENKYTTKKNKGDRATFQKIGKQLEGFSNHDNPLLDLKISKEYEKIEQKIISTFPNFKNKAKDKKFFKYLCLSYFFRNFSHYNDMITNIEYSINNVFGRLDKQLLSQDLKQKVFNFFSNSDFIRKRRENFILQNMNNMHIKRKNIKNKKLQEIFTDIPKKMTHLINYHGNTKLSLTNNVTIFINNKNSMSCFPEEVVKGVILIKSQNNIIYMGKYIKRKTLKLIYKQINSFLYQNAHDFILTSEPLDLSDINKINTKRQQYEKNEFFNAIEDSVFNLIESYRNFYYINGNTCTSINPIIKLSPNMDTVSSEFFKKFFSSSNQSTLPLNSQQMSSKSNQKIINRYFSISKIKCSIDFFVNNLNKQNIKKIIIDPKNKMYNNFIEYIKYITLKQNFNRLLNKKYNIKIRDADIQIEVLITKNISLNFL